MGAKHADQHVGQRCTNHSTATKAHDGHSGRHATTVGKPFDKCRNRGNVTEAEANARRAYRLAYNANMFQAGLAWHENRFGQLRELLDNSFALGCNKGCLREFTITGQKTQNLSARRIYQ